MAAHTLDQVDDTTDSLHKSVVDVQTTMALLHSTVGVLINSMAEILKSMADMKSALLPAPVIPPTILDDDLPLAPKKQQTTAVDSSIGEKYLNKIQIDMPVLDGHDVNLWTLRAERYFEFANFTETEKLRLAYMRVDGPALIWFNCCERHQPFIDWNDFKSQLFERFGGLDPRSAMERLLSLKQEDSVLHYLEQFEELASQLRDNTPELFYESVFFNGLKEEIREMLRLFNPKGINNIISMARRLENSPFCRMMKSAIGETDDDAHSEQEQIGIRD